MTSPHTPEVAAQRVGARVLTVGATAYPASLLHLHRPPSPLFAIGDLTLLDRPVIAIVGTRRATAYGERVASELGSAFGRAGACVVSGMARGVDACAHRGVLAVGGATAAVLGTGVDVAYPAGHRALHATIAKKGLLLSEFPPGASASPGCFPRRNRIIAALASMVVVVEAPDKSGALSTVNHALELGRTIAVVPGAIDSPQSAGSNALLRDGANLIATTADALSLAGLSAVPVLRESDLSPDQRAVWMALGEGALDMDSLTARAALPTRRCMAAVTSLELAGIVECELTGSIRRL
jgi:DNA processing protein